MKSFCAIFFTSTCITTYSKYMVHVDMNENIVTRKFPTKILRTKLIRIMVYSNEQTMGWMVTPLGLGLVAEDEFYEILIIFFPDICCDCVVPGMGMNIVYPPFLRGPMMVMTSSHSISTSMAEIRSVPHPSSWPPHKDTWKLSSKSHDFIICTRIAGNFRQEKICHQFHHLHAVIGKFLSYDFIFVRC